MKEDFHKLGLEVDWKKKEKKETYIRNKKNNSN